MGVLLLVLKVTAGGGGFAGSEGWREEGRLGFELELSEDFCKWAGLDLSI